MDAKTETHPTKQSETPGSASRDANLDSRRNPALSAAPLAPLAPLAPVAPVSRPGWRRLTGLLHERRDFRWLWIGQSVNFLGDSFYDIALMWYVYKVTGSAAESGLVLVFAFLPAVLLGTWFGALVDRGNRKRWLVIVSVLQMVAITGFATMVVVGYEHVWAFYTITAILAVGEVGFGPAWNSSLPALVSPDELITANALMAFSRQGFRLTGAMLGGTLVAVIGTASALYADGASFLVAALCFSLARIPSATLTPTGLPALTAPNSTWREMTDGARWVWARPNLVVILLVSMLSNVGLGPTNVLPAMYLQKTLHVGASAYGVFDASVGAGMIIGSLWIGTRRIHRAGLWFASGLAGQGLALAAVALAPTVGVADLANVLLGLALICAGVPLGTVFQALVPDTMRGRVGGISSAVSSLAIPVTYAFVGVLGDTVGARGTYAIGAGCLMVCALAAVSVRSVRRTHLPQQTFPF